MERVAQFPWPPPEWSQPQPPGVWPEAPLADTIISGEFLAGKPCPAQWTKGGKTFKIADLEKLYEFALAEFERLGRCNANGSAVQTMYHKLAMLGDALGRPYGEWNQGKAPLPYDPPRDLIEVLAEKDTEIKRLTADNKRLIIAHARAKLTEDAERKARYDAEAKLTSLRQLTRQLGPAALSESVPVAAEATERARPGSTPRARGVCDRGRGGDT